MAKLYGGILSPIDKRDYTVATVGISTETYPDEYIIENLPTVKCQKVGSCVANSLSSAMEISNNIIMSVGFIYGNRSDTDYQGEGMIIREALSHLVHDGDMTYIDFPYDVLYEEAKSKIAAITDAYDRAAENKIIAYYRIYNDNDVKKALLAGHQIIIMIPIYENGISLHNHRAEDDADIAGYHAILLVGWNTDGWVCQNSWGKSWGKNGLFYIDYDYAISEIWGIKTTESTDNIEIDDKKTTKISLIKKAINLIKYFFNKLFKK